MPHRSAESQAKMYLYDINNCARENGFKPDEKWEVTLASDEEKTVIDNKYNPTVWVKHTPAVLIEMFDLVTEQLQQAKTEVEQGYTKDNVKIKELKYLIAFSAKKLRR